MQITPEQLLAEAGRMALEIRLKDQALDSLAAENSELRGKLAAAVGEQDQEPGDG
jgi:hypothetical protein